MSSPALQIVDLEEHDLKSLIRIDAEVYPEPWSKKLWRAELSRSERVYLAAIAGDELVGYAGALLAVDDAHVTTIVASPDHQRRGIGSRLLLELVERCVSLGATGLTLEVRAANTAAQAMYRQFGMTPVGVRKGYYQPDDEDALVMWAREIDQPEYRARLSVIAEALDDGRAGESEAVA